MIHGGGEGLAVFVDGVPFEAGVSRGEFSVGRAGSKFTGIGDPTIFFSDPELFVLLRGPTKSDDERKERTGRP